MQSSVFKLTDLKRKSEPTNKIGFESNIAGKNETKKPLPEEVEEETVVEETVVFKDVRTTLVERDLILKRLQRPVISKLISKAPEQDFSSVEDMPIKKSKQAPELEKEDEPIELDVEDLDKPVQETGETSLIEKQEVQQENPPLPKEQGEKETETEEKPVKGKKSKNVSSIIQKKSSFDLSIAKIGDNLIKDRLPATQKYAVPVSSYYMNNRKIYISKLAQLFKPYSDKIASKASELSCKTLHSQSVDFELLTHQLVVRDYLNLYTPYRGLLLYHGLGSGKTCTSIGIAEGMKSGKQVVLMTPASLKMNFFNELKKCGDILYKKNQFWEFVSIEGDEQRAALLSQVLGLDIEYIRKRRGAWLMNVKKKSNFAELSDSDQKSVDQQIDQMIRNKYIDINYNGLRKEHLDEMSRGGKVNPFDNKVVIVDEAHNLVSRIANLGSKKGTIAYRLYHDLMDATNAKIIFLTGTPVINSAREIAILFNMLRGYIKTWTFSLETTTSSKVNTDIIMDAFREEGLTMYDFVEYTTNKLVVTRNPFGFVNVYGRKSRSGETLRGTEEVGRKRKSTKGGTKRRHKKLSHNVTKKSSVEEIYDDDEELLEREHEYKQLDAELYEGGGAKEDYEGVRLDEMGNISDHVFETRLTRILNDMGMRVVGKPKIKKELCLPDNDKVFGEMFINGEKGELVQTDLLKRRILGLTSYFRSAQEQLLPSFVKTPEGANYNIVNVDMSDYQFEEYEKVRKDERAEEKRRRKKTAKPALDELDDKEASTYRIYSRSACNFVFPAEYPRPTIRGNKEDVDFNEFDSVSEEVQKAQDDHFEDPDMATKPKDTAAIEYEDRIAEIYKNLAFDSARKRTKEYLTEDQLGVYSPKFLAILRNIISEENKGLHLIYSQFRTLEGIGLFKLVLEANGYKEFKVVKKGSQWEIENFDDEPEKPRYTLYTGTESAEEKDIVRNIYNGSWNLVPPSIVEKLRERHPNNLYGEVIKVLMITASGAEGINLRNCRFVHIMEPYWNMVRVDQVVGRARRICSHEDLPEDLRTVEVFIYLCRATPEQIDKNIELRIQDLSKLAYKVRDEKRGREVAERVPFTTDQYLLEIAQIKDSITRQILTAVKESAMDCSLYNNNPAEPLVCYGFGKVEAQSFGSYPTLERDAQEKPAEKKEKMSLGAVTIDGVKYAIDKKTNTVYDYGSYLKAKEKKGEILEIGKFDTRTQTIQFS